MVSLVSSKQLNVVVPPGTAGTIVSVAVTNPNGQKATLSNAFRYGKVLFQDNFESGNFSAWNALLNQTDNVVQSSLVHSGTHAARVHYSLAASTTHRDSNRWFQKQFSPALTHYFLRGYVYHQTPVSSSDPKAQRKLFYGKETVNGGWDNVLVSYGMQLSYHNSPPQDAMWGLTIVFILSSAALEPYPRAKSRTLPPKISAAGKRTDSEIWRLETSLIQMLQELSTSTAIGTILCLLMPISRPNFMG